MLLNLKAFVTRVLLKAERYTKTDMLYFAKNGSWLIFAQISIALLALTLSVIFANFIPKDVYGTYRFLGNKVCEDY